MSEILPEDAAPPNGEAHDFGPVPVMGTEPVTPKAKRKRKKVAKPRAARAPKIKPVDPILEASKASGTPTPDAADARPFEEATAPPIVRGAVDFTRLPEMFRADAPPRPAPPIKSTWRDRFVFGLRRMTGLDGNGNPEPVRLSTTLTVILCLAALGASAGVALAWW